jgi:hypothetical protein
MLDSEEPKGALIDLDRRMGGELCPLVAKGCPRGCWEVGDYLRRWARCPQ